MLPDGVTLYFIRHGETDWNKVQRYQGQTDIPLNDTGRAQAKRNGSILRELHGPALAGFDFVASPLSRTRETMEIVRRELGFIPHDYRHDERLKESHFGHWEGQLWSDLPASDPDGFAARLADTWNWVPRGGENYPMLETRVRAWLANITRNTVAVSHGNVSRSLRGILLNLSQAETPKLAVPQDKVLRCTGRSVDGLVQSAVEWI
jgi:probable phosphoglycerate mutase